MIAAERNSLAPLCYTNKEVMSTNSQQVNQPVRPGKASWDEGKPRRVVVQCLSFRDEHKPVLDSVPLSPALRLPGSPAILQMFAHLPNERMGTQLPKCLQNGGYPALRCQPLAHLSGGLQKQEASMQKAQDSGFFSVFSSVRNTEMC